MSTRSPSEPDHRTAFGGRSPNRVGGADHPRAAAPISDVLEPTTSESPAAMRIGLIDTGIIRQGGAFHPWFTNRVVTYDYFGDIDPLDTDLDGVVDETDGHGTFVAGQILLQAPEAEVTMARALGEDLGDDASIVSALALLADDGFKLINLSFGGSLDEITPPRSLQQALRALPDDVLVVCAAGNFGDTRPHWPGAFTMSRGLGDRVVCVGAVEPIDGVPSIATFSTSGDWVSAFADGVDLVGPYCWFSESREGALRQGRAPEQFEGYASWSGTSFSAAVVTGLIATKAIAMGAVDSPHTAWRQLAKETRQARDAAVQENHLDPDGNLPDVPIFHVRTPF